MLLAELLYLEFALLVELDPAYGCELSRPFAIFIYIEQSDAEQIVSRASSPIQLAK